MMRLLIPLVIALIGLGGGIGAAVFLRPDPMPAGEIEAALAPCGETGAAVAMSDHADPLANDRHDSAGEHGEGGHGDEESHASDSEYIELGDQFVVPVVEEGSVAALVVLTLSVESASGFGDEIIAHTPKLRDVFLRELLDHANLGGFRGSFTSNGTMDRLRTALREAGRKTMGADLRDVLILDINRQELS